MLLLDGKKCAQERKKWLEPRVQKFTAQRGRKPSLHVVLVGADPASEVYVRNKVLACQEVGIDSQVHRREAQVSPAALETLVSQLAQDESVDGILVQLPLPQGFPQKWVENLIPQNKDVDGLSSHSLGAFFLGQEWVSPCTPKGVLSLLEHYKIPLQGTTACVVGRSTIVGLPMAHLLLRAQATVTVCHSRTKDLSSHTRNCDLVVVAAGKPHLLSKVDFSPGAVVVDVGIHRLSSQPGQTTGTQTESAKVRLTGDVNPEGLENQIAAFTPVPGGVGPMTIITLLENTVTLAERRWSQSQAQKKV